MTWVAVAIAGSAVLGAATSSKAAKDAAKAQSGASDASIEEQRRQYDQTRADMAPWLGAGTESIGKIRDLLGLSGTTMTPEQIMAQSPGYQFRLDEGNKGIMNAARATGMSLSPATIKALMRYGQDYASGEYNNIFNRFSGVAGTGQNTGMGLGHMGQNTANTIGNFMTGAANARGAAGIAGANAWSGAGQNIANYYAQNQMMNRFFGGGRGANGGMSSTPYYGSYGGGNV